MRGVFVSLRGEKPLWCMLWAMVGPLLLHQAARPVEFQVNTYTADMQSLSEVAMDANGNFAITWSSYGQDGSGWGVYGRCYQADGTAIGEEFLVNSTTAGKQAYASVAMDHRGDFVVAWTHDPTGTDVFARRYDAGGMPVGSEFRVNTDRTGEEAFPYVAMNGEGEFVVAWDSWRSFGSGRGVYGQRYDADGTSVGDEFEIAPSPAGYESQPAVAVDADGSFVVVWGKPRGDGSGFGVFGQRYDRAGNSVDNEFQVNTYTAGNQKYPKVAMDDEGNFVVAWVSWGQDGPDWDVYARRYDANGTAVGDEFRVNTHTDGRQGMYWNESPGWWFEGFSVAMDADGDFVATWSSQDQDGSETGIYAQRYLADGTTLGSEFQINTNTTGLQEVPRVAMHPDGDFVVTWSSQEQDGPSWDVYADLFPWTSRCDFNGDGFCNVSDVDFMYGLGDIVAGVPALPENTRFDLNLDDLVNGQDVDEWLADAAVENGYSASYLKGDANLDGTINSEDLNALALNWRQSEVVWSSGDFTGEGEVDAEDLNLLGLNWRSTVPLAGAAAPIPEPSTITLALLSIVFLGGWRRPGLQPTF